MTDQKMPPTHWICPIHGEGATLCCDDAAPFCSECRQVIGHTPMYSAAAAWEPFHFTGKKR